MASAALGALTTDLANVTVLGAAGRLQEAAFGSAQERKLKGLLGEPVRLMLDGLIRSGEPDDDANYAAYLHIRLINLFPVDEVAGVLVSVAVDSEPLAVGRLRQSTRGAATTRGLSRDLRGGP